MGTKGILEVVSNLDCYSFSHRNWVQRVFMRLLAWTVFIFPQELGTDVIYDVVM